MEIAKKIAQWLWSKKRVREAQPVVVQIGHRVYQAARYVEVQRGGNHQTRLYVLGEMPPLHAKMRRLCYQTDPDSEHVWHLIAWFRQKSSCTEWQEVHPFGSHFILALFTPLENWASDQCQKKPSRRVPMTITEIGPTDASVGQHDDEKKD